ncbi:MAG: hypothetical protein P4L86_19575, partial [Mycobacterium sp.]|nr:hypothetical protein [Mycobacterium sp.]
MTASTRTVLELAARIVDYEPAPTAVGSAAPSLPTGRLRVVPEPGPTPSTEPVARPRPPDALPPAAALTFADAALRR